ncbi:MAG: tRNA pseudouridine(38-40) synthase TruA, partial [Deltaproteobacteria bacterium]
MPTYKIILQYDGTRYAGWQRQDGRTSRAGRQAGSRTIQAEVEKALKTALRRAVAVSASGRTDAGVHAVAQTAHFSVPKTVDPWRLKGSLNGILPADIRVMDIREAPAAFHARFKARAKTYVYVIGMGPERSAFVLPWAVEVPYALDAGAMRRAARVLVGRHDFKSFQGHDGTPRASVTRVDAVRVLRAGSRTLFPFLAGRSFLVIEVTASGFLRGMVRTLVGTLIEVG